MPSTPSTATTPHTAVDWLSVDEKGYLLIGQAGWSGNPDDVALLTELKAEADANRPPTPGEIAYEQAHTAPPCGPIHTATMSTKSARPSKSSRLRV